jgi:hypothetical protein
MGVAQKVNGTDLEWGIECNPTVTAAHDTYDENVTTFLFMK